MKVKVLGCSGSETRGHLPSGLLVNDVMMLDAGTITAALSVGAQRRITDVLISHPHLDHVKSLLFLADNLLGRINRPVKVRAIPEVIDAIRTHLMNNLIWPDFTRIPDSKNPVLAYKPLSVGKATAVAGLTVKALPMNHPVPAVGFLVSDGASSIIYSADTGPNERLWQEAAKTKNLKAIIVDTSFPNRLDRIADLSGHFTPALLHRDLLQARIGSEVPIYVYHIKPAYEKKVIREIDALSWKQVKILQQGKTYHF